MVLESEEVVEKESVVDECFGLLLLMYMWRQIDTRTGSWDKKLGQKIQSIKLHTQEIYAQDRLQFPF